MPTGDPFKKVRPGDRLHIPATAYNAFLDAAQDLRARQQSSASQDTPTFRQAGIVTVKNCTSSTLERFNVLGVDDPIFLPDENEQSFKNRVMFDGVKPVDPDHKGKFVILLEPLKASSLGMACIDGVCPAWVKRPTDSSSGSSDPPLFADINDGDTSVLLAGDAGAAQILWLDSEVAPGDSGWAVVRLGLPQESGVKPCLVKKVGGSDGDYTHYASWTYNIYALSDTSLTKPLATALPVDNSPARVFMGPGIAPATNGTVGLYYTKHGGGLGLHTVAEKWATSS